MSKPDRPSQRRAVVLSALAFGALALVAPNLIRSVESRRDAEAVCAAVEAGAIDEALALGGDFQTADAAGRMAGECHCWALIHRGRRAECAAHLETLLASTQGADWVPDPVLARLVVESRRTAGRHAEAADLAGRAAAAHPNALPLRMLEVMSRSALHGEERVLDELSRELPSASSAAGVRDRVVLARTLRRRGEHARAASALGALAPAPAHPLAAPWYVEKTGALAALGDLGSVQRWFAGWLREGGSPPEVRARYALCLSDAQLRDPAHTTVALLAAAVEESGALSDEEVVRRVHERLISHLLSDGETARALEVYDRAEASAVALHAISRRQIEGSRLARERALQPAAGEGGAARLQFRSPEAGTLLVSPPAPAPPDAAYVAYPLRSGEVLEVERTPDVTPVRWVLRASDDAVLASGAAWPSQYGAQPIAIAPQRRAPAGGVPLPARGPGDGRRRVFAMVLDCADWRITQYLRARGELPFLDQQLREGHVAVLDSRPALTAAALAKLVRPDLGEPASFVAVAHRLGIELGGLASVGRNPLEFLSALLPASPDLFAVIGAGERVAANMLFSHGGVDGGRSAEIVGPHGERRMAPAVQAYRPLEEEAVRRWPLLAARPGARSQVESIASAMDAAEAMADGGEVDLLLMRVEALDILTHALFGELTEAGQDDGQRALLDVYRYVDHRLGRLAGKLDADDVLVVMSDHGIRTPMEHETDAIFAATGAGVPRGRAPGRPELGGVSRVLSGLLDIETDWPDTGVAPWAGRPGVVAAQPSAEREELVPQHGFEP